MEYHDVMKSLKVIPTRRLVVHEETTESLTGHLMDTIQESPLFTNPVVVDRKTLTVLDGMHRVRAFIELGCPNIVCQLVDYFDKDIKIKAWYPVLRCINTAEIIGAVATRKTSFKKGLSEVKKMKAAFMLAFDRGRGKECFLVEPSKKPMKPAVFFAAQKHALSRLSHRHKIRYIPDDMHESYLKSSGAVVFYAKTFSKKEVISLARDKGILLPAKTTRHIIPMRALGLDIPMEWLELGKDEAQEKIDLELRKRSEAGAIRFYEEPVLVLNDYRFD